MKSFLKAIRGLIHKLALVLGYIIIVAAMCGILLAALYAVAEINKTKDIWVGGSSSSYIFRVPGLAIIICSMISAIVYIP